jgi:hypothetical protein
MIWFRSKIVLPAYGERGPVTIKYNSDEIEVRDVQYGVHDLPALALVDRSSGKFHAVVPKESGDADIHFPEHSPVSHLGLTYRKVRGGVRYVLRSLSMIVPFVKSDLVITFSRPLPKLGCGEEFRRLDSQTIVLTNN